MSQNPYKYEGPLDPEKDKLVCITREEEIRHVIRGILKGDYWSVLGPVNTGKTTFLRQLQQAYFDAHYIYVDFEMNQFREEDFYQWLMDTCVNEIPAEQIKPLSTFLDDESPELGFFEFLKNFKPKDPVKKVIFLFDEIEHLTFQHDFLSLWRKIYHERYYKKELDKYVVIITGSKDLITLTLGANSPFNIAETLHISDLSNEDSSRLIDEPFLQLNIKIEPKAKEKLISHLAGHPQMLQHACHILVEKADAANDLINEKKVDNAINLLIEENLGLNALKQQLSEDNRLGNLIKSILNGKNNKYSPFKEFSISGAGPIGEKNSNCVIRNKVYVMFLRRILKNQENNTSQNNFNKKETQ